MNKKSQLFKNRIVSSFRKNIILGVVVLIFLLANILVSLQTVNSGSKLSELEKQENVIIHTNRDITSQLVKSTSLTNIEKTSDILGFAKPESILYARDIETVASKL